MRDRHLLREAPRLTRAHRLRSDSGIVLHACVRPALPLQQAERRRYLIHHHNILHLLPRSRAHPRLRLGNSSPHLPRLPVRHQRQRT